LLKKIVPVVFSVLRYEFLATSPLTNRPRRGSMGRSKWVVRVLILQPARGPEIHARMGVEILLIAMAAAHQETDAIMRARKDQLSFPGMQAFRSPAAERISQKDCVVATGVCLIDTLLKIRAHRHAQVVQTHGQKLNIDRMR
jgi:hypothetical protein